MKIYTRTGDKGDTGLFGGGRVPKNSPRVAAYGDVDELNAVLGVALAQLDDAEIARRIEILQSDLFVIGSHLATPAVTRGRTPNLPAYRSERIAEMEGWIDRAEEELAPLRNFILPGGSTGGAALHHARTVCRRAERSVVALAADEPVDEFVIVFLNRLSDLLFDFARLANHRAGTAERIWSGETT